MREIKFRAWFKKFKEMYGVSTLFIYDGMVRVDRKWDTLIALKELELMQFTGLLDKNGKEIYEGDIVTGIIETLQHIKGRVYIESEHGRLWGCYIADGPEDKQFGSWDMRQLCWGVDEYTPHCEVIGNIYENPDLLKNDQRP